MVAPERLYAAVANSWSGGGGHIIWAHQATGTQRASINIQKEAVANVVHVRDENGCWANGNIVEDGRDISSLIAKYEGCPRTINSQVLSRECVVFGKAQHGG